MLLTKQIEIKWIPKTREYYISKGYIFTKHGDIFSIKIEDLMPSSSRKVDVLCLNCNEARVVTYSNWTRRKVDTCNKCTYSINAKKVARDPIVRQKMKETQGRGSAHKNYKGGEKRDRKNDAYMSDWRKAVYIRDNHTCQCCAKNKKYLNAHHLDGFSWCKEKRYDPSNGITLCKECHYEFHKIYTDKQAKREHFFEWMSANFIQNFSNLEQILEFNKNV